MARTQLNTSGKYTCICSFKTIRQNSHSSKLEDKYPRSFEAKLTSDFVLLTALSSNILESFATRPTGKVLEIYQVRCYLHVQYMSGLDFKQKNLRPVGPYVFRFSCQENFFSEKRGKSVAS